MRRTIKFATTIVASAIILTLPPPSVASEASPVPATPPVTAGPPEVEIAATDIDENFVAADEVAPESVEAQAVEAYVQDLGDDGPPPQLEELEVAAVRSDEAVATIVQPTAGESVESVVISQDEASGDVVAAAAMTSEVEEVSDEQDVDDVPVADDDVSTQGAPYWKDWVDSFRATVRINVWWKSDWDNSYSRIGRADFQTVRRQRLRDGNNIIDTWQMGRSAIATPSSGWRVQKLWASQNLHPDAQPYGREWIHSITNPRTGFSNCESNTSISLSWITIAVKDCEEYDVWLGEPGHQRMYYDQGASTNTGSREIAYTSGFSMKNGKSPRTTYYEFVTFRDGPSSIGTETLKCKSNVRGAQYDVTVRGCKFFEGGTDDKFAYETQ